VTANAGIAALVLRVSAAIVATVVLIAAVTLVGFAGPARDWLGFTFPGVPATVEEVWEIFVSNARIALVVLAASFAVNAPWLMAGDAAEPGWRWRCWRLLLDVALGCGALFNLVIVGSALGGYGVRMAVAILPHGPFELLAFSSVLALYLRARRGPVPRRTAALLSGASAGLLLLGATAEVLP